MSNMLFLIVYRLGNFFGSLSIRSVVMRLPQ